jgi:hypothetical protein
MAVVIHSGTSVYATGYSPWSASANTGEVSMVYLRSIFVMERRRPS